MSRGLKEISIVIVRSNPLTYGTTEGRMRMLGKASRGTKGGKMERISTEFPCLPGSRIYSLTSPDCKFSILIPHNANATFAKDVNYSQPKYFFQRYEHNTLIRLDN